MKKMLRRLWALAAALAFVLGGSALAQDADIDEAAFEGALRLETGETYDIDLDNDGVEESVYVRMEGSTYEENITLKVETLDLLYSYPTYIYYDERAYCVDLDGDGRQEILLSGDEASADYSTWCLRFDPEQGLQAVPFADAGRGENTGEYGDFGYGRVDAIHGATLTLTGSQDALGTWWCSREFTLRDGRFELDDDGIWHVVEDFEDAELWEYRALKLTRELQVTMQDGTPGTLSAGTRLVITETDKQSFVGFLTEDGLRGRIAVAPDEENGWGFLIDGASEYDYFEYIPYAD